jgi:hypothetical protein
MTGANNKQAHLSCLLTSDPLISTPAKKFIPLSASPKDKSCSPTSENVNGASASHSSDESEFPSLSHFACIKQLDLKTVILAGLSDSSDEIPILAQQLLKMVVMPLVNITIGDLLCNEGPCKILMTQSNYPDWDSLCAIVQLTSCYATGPPPSDFERIF